MSAEFHVGTSGWYYKHWLGRFYPDDIIPGDMLAYYSQHFDTVEINNSFYHLPSLETAAKWYEKTPPGFLFAVKASRYLTHMKRLLDTGEGLENFFAVVRELKEKAGPILFQLPPRWKANLERLETFLSALPKEYRYTFEFRDPTWNAPAVYEILRKHRVAYCITNRHDENSPVELTADFTYVRFHGGDPEERDNYQTASLQRWADRLHGWRSELKEIYIYFNNDWEAFAIHNAVELKRMLHNTERM